MTDLASLDIKNFAFGQQNMHIIVSDPISPSIAPPVDSNDDVAQAEFAVALAVDAGLIPAPPAPNASALLQLFYPAGSINPGTQPQGGADFYASPLPDVRAARNVTLAYSVFFPADFDWVRGGKLPGLYGGHDGCSGGDAAADCWSTRLMWRADGAGELYLYAPKDRQTAALCHAPPLSLCDSDFGLSVARGAFRFARGNWTRVRQTVALNTPGAQDGGFALDVDGVRVLERADVTFFGGHEQEYATPRDQFTWFRDFEMVINE
ncbi:uncharacterized protein BXZ73DRAFT_92201 [Epithele typhae]|uniref:uncharacterized protein n=1 Tax=Epithele typhae TaxID=378194 RepID=UPI0020071F22|nr:uncharacterized protein BXZ73DRAFT_92201 [Epithele typhae]KAH9918345.1 hypothetical protein BXZ73DRAFT_92201 [Epithele typhae]